MKFTCSKESLNNAVQTVQKAISSKNTMPILSGIFIMAEGDKVTLQATDYNLGISCTIEANVESEGKVVLYGRYFQELVRRLPGENVEVSQNKEERSMKISSLSSDFNLLMMPYEEFPVLKSAFDQSHLEKIADKSIVVKDNVLKDLIKKTSFACATEEIKPIYTGVLLENDNKEIRMVATNTHRMAVKKSKHEENLDLPQENEEEVSQIIIPYKYLNELSRLLNSEVPTEVKIYFEKSKVYFIFDNVYFECRLIEGKYPDYSKVIPKEFKTKSVINTALFQDAVERVSLIAKERDYNIVKFYFKENEINITSNNPEVGKAFESIPLKTEGEEIEISFNATYVIEILKNIEKEEIVFSLNGPLSAACIMPLDDEDYIYIVTPVRTL
ncbi:DNA polymerase III subunit beta [Selenomonadales bacterium OttesenSCG-928-I06]|nr:DNA polymerase III subunit beta [Selenomonadales bacterium OttesenSCG-928-I06]